LRVLQEGTFERVGEVRTRIADVRIVAATNRHLSAEIEAGRFRADLYYRLAVYPITLPALRERKEDLAPLVAHLLGRICRRLGRAPVALTSEQLVALSRHDWPGNVREQLNVLERAVISAETDAVVELPLADELRAGLRSPAPPAVPAPAEPAPGLPSGPPHVSTFPVPALEGPMFTTSLGAEAAGAEPPAVLPDLEMRRHERDNLRRALETCHGKIYGSDGAAALLGMKPTTLASRLKRLQIVSRPRP
jgi:transcriptional regulator with GAF, ATPase, and Fis domain